MRASMLNQKALSNALKTKGLISVPPTKPEINPFPTVLSRNFGDQTKFLLMSGEEQRLYLPTVKGKVARENHDCQGRYFPISTRT